VAFWKRGPRADAADFDRALRRSLRAAVEGDAARAQTWLERAVEIDSADLDTYQALARIYRDQGEIGRAIRMHQNLLLRTDLSTEERDCARLELARDYEAGGFRDHAIRGYEELLAARPRDPDVLDALARVALAQGDARRLAEILPRLRRADPDRAERIESEIALRREPALASAAGRGGVVSRLVTRFAARRQDEAAERALRARLERDPDDHAARVALARALVARGEPGLAREELSRALERSPEAWMIHVEHGRLLLGSGDASAAREAHARLIEALAGAAAGSLPGAIARAGDAGAPRAERGERSGLREQGRET